MLLARETRRGNDRYVDILSYRIASQISRIPLATVCFLLLHTAAYHLI